jgi:hypothetical protein
MNELAAGTAALGTAIAAVESRYTGNGGEKASVGAGLLQAETDIDALQAQDTIDEAVDTAINARIKTVSKSFSFTDVAALGANPNGVIDFAAALPANAIVIGAGVDVTAVFDNVGNTASMTIALGITGVDPDGFMVAGNADTVCKLGTAGALNGGLVGAVLPSILVDPDVNCNTITKGTAVAYISYIVAA